MAVANTKSLIIQNAEARPVVKSMPWLSGGRIKEDVATVEVLAADDDNSIYRFTRVRSGDRVSAIEILNDAITGGSAFELGLYETAENGGAVVAKVGGGDCTQLWGSAISMASARTDVPLQAVHEALNIDQIEKRVFELIGFTADPGRDYEIGLKATTVGTTNGTISMRVRRNIGD